MSTLEQIRKSVDAQLNDYELFVHSSMASESDSATAMLDYIFSNRGKGIRPLLVLLSASLHKACDDNSDNADNHRHTSSRTNLAAMLLEMIHTASLIHDDIIDEAYIRRGKPSINALWGAKKAVLIGDYIFARGFMSGMQSGNFDIVSYITHIMGTICNSELTQNDQSDKLTMTREIYLDIIYGKTATMIGACSGVGAMSVGASAEEIDHMKQFGDSLGMAFQIKDDILDFTLNAETGKPVCNDLRERKITLPLLTVLENASPVQHRKLLRLLSNVRRSPSNVDLLYNEVISGGGIDRASEIMYKYIEQAKSFLTGYTPSSYLDSLYLLCDYVAQRDK